jgi:hypothetical protein
MITAILFFNCSTCVGNYSFKTITALILNTKSQAPNYK